MDLPRHCPRLEILYHSIHYFDLIRSWLGSPRSVYARTVKHPLTPSLAATRTTAILDYGDSKRVLVTTNHGHNFGPAHQQSFVQWEGLAGAARITMGINPDYPAGRPDTLEYAKLGQTKSEWTKLSVSGNNFPDGFIGTMGALQALAEGSAPSLPSHFEDAFQTMELVEALYRSSEQSGELRVSWLMVANHDPGDRASGMTMDFVGHSCTTRKTVVSRSRERRPKSFGSLNPL